MRMVSFLSFFFSERQSETERVIGGPICTLLASWPEYWVGYSPLQSIAYVYLFPFRFCSSRIPISSSRLLFFSSSLLLFFSSSLLLFFSSSCLTVLYYYYVPRLIFSCVSLMCFLASYCIIMWCYSLPSLFCFLRY